MSTDTPGDDSPLKRAAGHADLGLPVAKGTHLRPVKRLVTRMARFLTDRQVAFNHEIVDAEMEGRRQLDAVLQQLDERTARIDGVLARLDADTEAIRQDQRRELGRWRTDHALVERVLREVRLGGSPQEALARVERVGERQRQPLRRLRGPAPRRRGPDPAPARRVRARPRARRGSRARARRRHRAGRVPRGHGERRDRRVRRRHQRGVGRPRHRARPRGDPRRRARAPGAAPRGVARGGDRVPGGRAPHLRAARDPRRRSARARCVPAAC